MLKWNFIKFRFFRFFQSGLYIDFIIKHVSEIFVRNVFIYGAQFFSEKYIIEYLTKKVIDSSLFNSNKFIGINNLSYSYYFIQIITIILYSFSIYNFFFIFF